MSYSFPITFSPANTLLQRFWSESNKGCKARICSIAFASIWAATAGAAIAQALNPNVSWFIAMTLPLPILSLVIPDFSGDNRSLRERISSCARSVFSFWGAGLLIAFGFGVTSSMLAMSYAFPIHPSSSITSSTLLLSQWGLLGVHFLSAYAKSVYSKTNDSSHQDEIEEVNPDRGNISEEHKELISQTTDLQESNAKMEKAFKKLKALIESDPELKQSFSSCYQATRHILLPPGEICHSPPVDDPLVEEWGKQFLLQNYYEGLMNRLQSFLKVNPEFLVLLQTKIDQKEIALLTGGSTC